MTKCVEHFQALGDFLAPRLTGGFRHFHPQFFREFVEVEVTEQFANRFGSHPRLETARPVFLHQLAVPRLAQ